MIPGPQYHIQSVAVWTPHCLLVNSCMCAKLCGVVKMFLWRPLVSLWTLVCNDAIQRSGLAARSRLQNRPFDGLCQTLTKLCLFIIIPCILGRTQHKEWLLAVYCCNGLRLSLEFLRSLINAGIKRKPSKSWLAKQSCWFTCVSKPAVWFLSAFRRTGLMKCSFCSCSILVLPLKAVVNKICQFD